MATKVKKGPILVIVAIVLAIVGYVFYPKLQGRLPGGAKGAGSTDVEPEKPKAPDDAQGKTGKTEPPVPAKPGFQAAAKNLIRVAGDPWSGYSTFRDNPDFTKRLKKDGLECSYVEVLDQAERFKAMKDGKIDVAVTTVDAYLSAGADAGYPGLIVLFIDESDGGDALVLGPKLKSLDDLTNGVKIAYAENTPSEYLLNYIEARFKSVKLSELTLVPQPDAKPAYDKLKAGEVDAAIVWEPYTSNAVNEIPGSTRIFDTGKGSQEVIMDVAVASRDMIQNRRAELQKFMNDYFETIEYYKNQKARHIEFLAKDGGVDNETAGRILSGILFLDLPQNAFNWFGLGDQPERVSKQILKTAKVLMATGKMHATTEVNINLFDDSFMKELKKVAEDQRKAFKELDPAISAEIEKPKEQVIEFAKIDPKRVDEAMVKVGSLDVKTILFRSGSADLDPNAQMILSDFAQIMREFPAYYCRVDGHTDNVGNAEQNRKLSEKRAWVIADYLINKQGFDRNKLIVNGFGPDRPMADNATEDGRARNRRTDFILVKPRQP